MSNRENQHNAGEDTISESKSRQAEEKKARQAQKAMLPGFDPELYNADGTLRTVHQMPNPDEAWEEAQKARYIRTKELLERDKELSVKEIFEKGSN